MGVYLSAPILDKESFDEQCCGFSYGASSMQGWRISQEDAHNCIPEFDKSSETSFFAVYDGHGGAEVAKYCQLHFPDLVKSMIEKDAEKDLTELIQAAFIQFDATLTEEDVVKKLKELAGKDDDMEEEEDPDIPVGKTETDMLRAEADLPLEELLAKYKKPDDSQENEQNGNGECSMSSPSSSKISPAASSSKTTLETVPTSSSNGPCAIEESNQNCNANGVSSEESTAVAVSSSSETISASSSSLGERASKTKAAAYIAKADNLADSSDSEEESEEEDKMLDDSSDDDDDEDEDEEQEEIPVMDMTNEEPGSDSGCTACVVLKRKDHLYVANAGDSRCVLSRDGVAVELSFDHKPEDDPERERIEKAGGKVTADGRVNGGLNLSRAFGDHVYKRNKDLPSEEQMISPLPDVKMIELNDKDQFFVIACDGIWNFLSSQEVVDYVKERLCDPDKRNKPSVICEELFEHCLAPNTIGDGTGCDNMTCIIVVLDSAQFQVDANQEDKLSEPLSTHINLHNQEEESEKSAKRAIDNGEPEPESAKKVKMDTETMS